MHDMSRDQIDYSHDSRENSQKWAKNAKNAIFEVLKVNNFFVIGATIKVKGSIDAYC